MARSFLSINSNFNDFSTLPSRDINAFLLENNGQALSKIYGFCQRPEDILFVTGFFGTGKTQIVNHLLNYLDKDVYSFKVNCSSSLTLDDVLLMLWAQFISIAANSEITYKYRQTSSFTERVTGCFADSPSNIVITLFDFDLIQEDNLQDILDFIMSVSSGAKIKVIVVSKTFDTSLLPDNIAYTKVILKALSKIVFEKFIADKNIKATPRIIDELYKITRGYYFYTEISTMILSKKDLSINDYLVAYTNSGLSFDKFLAKAFVSMLPENCRNLLNILSVLRHPVNSEVLDYMECYDKPVLDYLRENKFLKLVDNAYIINNYFRCEVLDEIDETAKNSIHKLLVKFYNSQLPLKPSERLLLLSRTTMRAELGHHSGVAVAKPDTETAAPACDLENTDNETALNTAQQLTSDYNYNEAIKIYLMLLDRSDIDKYNIYHKLADLYLKVGNWKYSLHYFNHLVKYYREKSDDVEVNRIKLEVAQIYYQSYKTNEAINILYEIISESSDTAITINAYTVLGNIYISLAAKNKAYELYNKAIVLSERDNYTKNLPELYFKFAILADENDDVDNAVTYYKNCIDISEDNNKYKSLSYSNLGDFYLDMNDTNLALENFKAAYALDEKNSNNYGMYYSASNVAKLIVHSDSDEGYRYLLQAKTSAIRTNDIFAMANSGLHLGDYFSNTDKPESALKEYFAVYNLVKDKFKEENIKKILSRIEDIKLKIGENRFNELYG